MSLHVILTDMPAPTTQAATDHARSPETTFKNSRTPNGPLEIWVAKYVIEAALSPRSGLNDIDAARQITQALKEREKKDSQKEWYCIVARSGMSAVMSWDKGTHLYGCVGNERFVLVWQR